MPLPRIKIDLDLSSIPQEDHPYFEAAKERWAAVLKKSHTSTIESSSLPGPPPGSCTYPDIIDDIFVCIRYESEDFNGTVFRDSFGNAIAEPIYFRDDTRLPITGHIIFQNSSIEFYKRSWNYTDVIPHQLGHVLGFGALWQDRASVCGVRQKMFSLLTKPRGSASISNGRGDSFEATLDEDDDICSSDDNPGNEADDDILLI